MNVIGRFPILTVAVLVSWYCCAPALAGSPVEGLAAFKASLHPVSRTRVDMRWCQTPVKQQRGGTCYTFSLVGAIEAKYKKRCALNPSLASYEPYCADQQAGTDLDLSEWQFFEAMATQTPTRNPWTSHESLAIICSFNGYRGGAGNTWASEGPVLAAARGIRIATEVQSPWPDASMNQAMIADSLGLTHQLGTDYTDQFCSPDPPVADMNPRYDRFGYDPLNYSYDAHYDALYGVTAVQVIPKDDVRLPPNLELYLANGYEVDVSMTLKYLYCPPGYDLDGAARCWTSIANGMADEGHHLLAVGFDHTRRLFLFKNSWGASLPYLWIPYSFVRRAANGPAFIVRGVRPARAATAGHEQGYLGTWAVFNGDGSLRGKISIRRTREMPHGLPTYARALVAPYVTVDSSLRRRTRLGTFITPTGSRRRLFGELTTTGKLRLYVGTSVGPGGDLLGRTYTGGTLLGDMTLASADFAADNKGHIYRRDFSGRAESNWEGTWDLTVYSGQFQEAAVLAVANDGTVPDSSNGRFPFTGTYSAASQSYPVTGYVDQRGEHAIFEFDIPGVGNAGTHCVLDLAHTRTIGFGGVEDRAPVGDSRLTCGDTGPRFVAGLKRVPVP